MRKKLSLALAAILTVSTLILPAGAAGPRFKDVPEGHWAYESIEYAVDHGYFSGTSADTFSPDGTMTRAMLWTVLASMAGESAAAEPGQPWYQGGQNWAKENGISDGSNPNGNITREQFATMLYNFAELTGAPTDKNTSVLNTFSDRGAIASYAVDAMVWAVTHSIVSGTSGTTISPTGLATRAQAAVMLMQFDKMGEGETTNPGEPDPPVVDYETNFGASEVSPYHGNTVIAGSMGHISISSNPYRANVEAGVTYTVTSSDPSVATLSRDYLDLGAVSYYVHGVNPGTVTITAVGSDGFHGSMTFTVTDENGNVPGTGDEDVNWGEYADLKKNIVQLINEERSRNGLNTLEVSPKAMQAASIRAQECTVLFDHTRPDGTGYGTVFAEVNLLTGGNEIIASGFTSAPSVVNAWIASPGHHKAMTDNGVYYIGVGVAKGFNGTLYYSVLLTVAGD